MAAVDMQIRLWDKDPNVFQEKAAQSGMAASDMIAAFIQAIVQEDVRLQQWQKGQKKNNFLSYLAGKGKLSFITRLIDKADSYQNGIPYAFAMGSRDQVKENLEKSEACWTLIWKEYNTYKDENPYAKPLQDELQTVINWRKAYNGKTNE